MNVRSLVLAAAFLAASTSSGVAAQARTFGGYDCGSDCAGLAAGYRWAEERDIDEPSECAPGLSDAFYKGCLVYIRDPDRGAERDDQGEPVDVAARSRSPA